MQQTDNPKRDGTWRFAGVELDLRSRELRVGGEPVEIEPKSLDLLVLLLQHAGEVVTTEEFLEGVWPGRIVAESAIQNIVSKLRKLLGDDAQEIIKTIPRVGYRLVAAVEYLAPRPFEAPVLELKAGDAIPGREQWRLTERLQGGYGEVWIGEHPQTREKRAFKFCISNEHLSSLKREVTLHRLLRDALGERDDFVPILEWNFESPPYFIESAYSGLDLHRWLDGKGGATTLSIADRIDLVIRIGEALAAAHSVGVLHKDLKPQNILVEECNGRPHVRLGDFGAGRLLDAGKLGEFGITRLGFTRTAAVGDSTSGTLMYMAPELLSGGVPSVQSDVYSVGVILYQLVAGNLDKLMAPGWETDIADEFLREDIREAAHGSRELRLPSIQLLVGRLKALDSRRQERRRQQEKQEQARLAVEALNRSHARRPWLIAAGLMMVAGVAVSTYFFMQARAQAMAALEQAHRAEALNDFLSRDILRAASPHSGGRPDVKLLDAIKQSIPHVEQRFSKNPELEATVDRALGDLLADPYDVPGSLREYQREVVIDNQLYGADDARTLDAQIHVANVMRIEGKTKEAQGWFEKYYPALKAKRPPSDPAVLYARDLEALFAVYAGRTEENLALLRPLRDDCRKSMPDSELTERVENQYLSALGNARRFEEQEKEARALVADRAEKYGSNDFRTLYVRSTLGRVFVSEGKFDDAERELKATVALMIQAVGPDHLDVAATEGDLADMYEVQGRWDEALPYRKTLYTVTRNKDGDDNLWTIQALLQYANNLDTGKHAADAVPLARQAYDAASRALSSEPGNFVLANTRMVLAQSLIDTGRPTEARPIVDEFQSLVDGKPYDGNWDYKGSAIFLYAQISKGVGNVELARKQATDAKALFDKAENASDSKQAADFLKTLDVSPAKSLQAGG